VSEPQAARVRRRPPGDSAAEKERKKKREREREKKDAQRLEVEDDNWIVVQLRARLHHKRNLFQSRLRGDLRVRWRWRQVAFAVREAQQHSLDAVLRATTERRDEIDAEEARELAGDVDDVELAYNAEAYFGARQDVGKQTSALYGAAVAPHLTLRANRVVREAHV